MKFLHRLFNRATKPIAPDTRMTRPDENPADAPAPNHPALTEEQIAFMTARFDAAKWDATADADMAAEKAAKERQAARA